MAVLVRRGDFALAKEVGNQGVVQIAVDSALIHCHHQLARGTESTVWSGTFLGEPVGIKKAIIGTAADLNRFRREVVALASLADPAIVKLLGARVLPPDYSIITPLYSKSLEVRPMPCQARGAKGLNRPHSSALPTHPSPRTGAAAIAMPKHSITLYHSANVGACGFGGLWCLIGWCAFSAACWCRSDRSFIKCVCAGKSA